MPPTSSSSSSSAASAENLNKVLEQLRKIVVLFFEDATATFRDFFTPPHGSMSRAYEYYSRFGDIEQRHVQKLYNHLCRRLPPISTLILTSDENIFNDEFIAHNELGDACLLPAIDFRHFFRAAGVTPQIKDAIWTYIQSFLMLTLNDCNPLRREQAEKLERFLQGDDEDDDGASDAFMQMFNEPDMEGKIDEISAKLNEFFQAREGAGAGAAAPAAAQGGGDDRMDEEEDGGAGAEAGGTPMFSANEAKGFMDSLSNSKIGKLAREVTEEIMQQHPELAREFEEIIQASGSNTTSRTGLLKFLFSKGVTMRQLISLLRQKLRQKMNSGEISMRDLSSEVPQMFQNLRNHSPDQLKELMKNSGINLPKGAELNMAKFQQMCRADETRQRIREKLDRLDKQRKQAESAVNTATAAISDFTSEDAVKWASTARGHFSSGGAAAPQHDIARAQAEIELLFANNAGIVQNNGRVQHQNKHKKKR